MSLKRIQLLSLSVRNARPAAIVAQNRFIKPQLCALAPLHDTFYGFRLRPNAIARKDAKAQRIKEEFYFLV